MSGSPPYLFLVNVMQKNSFDYTQSHRQIGIRNKTSGAKVDYLLDYAIKCSLSFSAKVFQNFMIAYCCQCTWFTLFTERKSGKLPINTFNRSLSIDHF